MKTCHIPSGPGVRLLSTLVVLTALGLAGCIGRARRADPFYEVFYEKARLIMTEEEDHIYRAIRDTGEKEKFIEEFWRIRDPDTGTEENEARQEFEERIEFADRWLNDRRTSEFQPETGERAERSRGWATDRGRVYVTLGPPDSIGMGGGYGPFSETLLNRGSYQTWYYVRYDLHLSFSRRTDGVWRMNLHSEVFQAMDEARMELISASYRQGVSHPFRFRSDWKDGGLRLVFPAERIQFKQEDGILRAGFKVRINVYRDNRRVDTLEETPNFEYTERETRNLKNIEMHIPFHPGAGGRYLFDIVAEDLMSLTGARYRSYVKKKF